MEGTSSDRLGDETKPLLVRVKRKSFQRAIDALWIEIHERPSKLALLDFGKLSISEASSSRVEELKTKKILVEHMETLNSPGDTFHVLQSFLAKSSDELSCIEEIQNRRRSIMSTNTHDQMLTKAKQSQEAFARNARFNQIWKSRRNKNGQSEGEAINEMCQFYDIVRVDDESDEVMVQKDDSKDSEDAKMLVEFLPLLREVIPTAALEIEHDLRHSESEKDNDYVYDYYTVRKGAEDTLEDSSGLFPLVQVEQGDDYWGDETDSEYDTDDSNVETHPRNDYPDEETSEVDDEDDESSSNPRSDGDSEEEEKDDDLEVGNETSSSLGWDHHDDSVPHGALDDSESHCLGFDDGGYSDEHDAYDEFDGGDTMRVGIISMEGDDD